MDVGEALRWVDLDIHCGRSLPAHDIAGVAGNTSGSFRPFQGDKEVGLVRPSPGVGAAITFIAGVTKKEAPSLRQLITMRNILRQEDRHGIKRMQLRRRSMYAIQ